MSMFVFLTVEHQMIIQMNSDNILTQRRPGRLYVSKKKNVCLFFSTHSFTLRPHLIHLFPESFC